MKKVIAVLLSALMIFALAACGNSNNGSGEEEIDTSTVAGALYKDFSDRVKADSDISAQDLADALLTNDVITFMGMAMPVEEGFLTGFDNAEITGFDEGVMFAPMISTTPFVGYVFVLSSGTDADAFVKNLEDNANLRWNICTEADEMKAGVVNNRVFFVMAPESFEEE